MFTFQPSLFQAALFSFIVEKTSQRRCEIAKPKHCQTKPAVSYGSFQQNIMQTCQKICPVRYHVFCTPMRGSLEYFFFTLIIQCVGVSLSDTSYLSLESNVDVISPWPLNRNSYSVLCHVRLSDYFRAQRDIALQHETRVPFLCSRKNLKELMRNLWFVKSQHKIDLYFTELKHASQQPAKLDLRTQQMQKRAWLKGTTTRRAPALPSLHTKFTTLFN